MLFRAPFNWQEIDRLRREMDRLFETVFPRVRQRAVAGFPAMNVWTNEEGMVVTAELPGVNPDSIDISVTGAGDQLTVSGSRIASEAPENARYHRRERSYGEFTRTFQLPFAVDAEKVEATYKLGTLIISLPRAEAEKPKKIPIKAA